VDPEERKLRIYELWVKGVIGALLTAVVTVFGFQMETSRRVSAEREESNRVMIAENNKDMTARRELSARQKELDLDLGIKMFQTLMSNYLRATGSQEGPAKRQQQMLLLRLISLNFQDSPVNIKPLFEELDNQLTNMQEKKRLRQIAMEVARHQAFRLTFLNGVTIDPPDRVKQCSEIPLDIQATIKIDEVDKDMIKASLVSEATAGTSTLGPFSVNYFDLPLIDNIKLGSKRVSLLLLDSDGLTAKIQVIIFSSYLAPDRFDVKESFNEIKQIEVSSPNTK
jgi:hypothetical protein